MAINRHTTNRSPPSGFGTPGRGSTAAPRSSTRTGRIRRCFAFDLKALGFAAGTLIEGLDAVDKRPVTVADGRLSLEVEPELFRLVKLGLPGEPTGKNLDPKHPEPLP